MLKRCGPGQAARAGIGGRGRRAGWAGKRDGAEVGMGGRGGWFGRAGGEGERWSRGAVEARGGEGIVKISLSDTDRWREERDTRTAEA